jgi:hypothetical protein
VRLAPELLVATVACRVKYARAVGGPWRMGDCHHDTCLVCNRAPQETPARVCLDCYETLELDSCPCTHEEGRRCTCRYLCSWYHGCPAYWYAHDRRRWPRLREVNPDQPSVRGEG